ncbi:Na+/H+ antiporter [Candidatus Dependentiae bacterium Noda2021]|nr:Na+/H+ antiporter [Candidatus Dependentiae bacterium Noda2021]
MMKRLRTARAVQFASMSLSSVLFIDDYLSYLTTGHVIRPITDQFRIPRVKLAFLIHSMGGPVVILGLVSSWVALITSQLDQAGISPQITASTKIISDPFFIYLGSIPFIFYSFLIITSTWYIVFKNISYGPMRKQEVIAHKTQNLFGGKPDLVLPHENTTNNGKMSYLIVPLLVLVTSFLLGTAYSGGYYLLGGNNSLFSAFKNNTQPFFVLFIAGLSTLICSTIIAIRSKHANSGNLPYLFASGCKLMHSPVVMVLLASILGIILRNDLKIGVYLAHIVFSSIPVFLIPLIFFAVSFAVAFITGTSWGTIALMIPIATQMLITLFSLTTPTQYTLIPLLFPVLGAIFSGATAGDHLSPISETTIMSSSSAGCYPVDHTYTQFFYAAPALCATAFSFLISGLLIYQSLTINFFISLASGLVICLGLLTYLNQNRHGKKITPC